MNKQAFDKIATGLEEALSVARGETKPFEVHVPVENQLKAIEQETIEALKAQDFNKINFLRNNPPRGATDNQFRPWVERFDKMVRKHIRKRLESDDFMLEQANQEVEKAGVKYLLEPPPIDKFDPRKEYFWSIPMVAAWIMWRDIDKVRDHWGDFLRECKELREVSLYAKIWGDLPGVKGWRVRQPEAKNIFQTFEAARELQKSHNEKFEVTPDNAKKELLSAFQKDKLIAYGDKLEYEPSGYSVKPNDKGRVQVTSTEWRDDYFSDHNSDYDAIGSGAGECCSKARYKNVEILQSKVLELWPAIGDEKQSEAVIKPIKNITPLQRSIIEAGLRVWPDSNGVPPSTTGNQEIISLIGKDLKENGNRVPNESTILRVFDRKKIRAKKAN